MCLALLLKWKGQAFCVNCLRHFAKTLTGVGEKKTSLLVSFTGWKEGISQGSEIYQLSMLSCLDSLPVKNEEFIMLSILITIWHEIKCGLEKSTHMHTSLSPLKCPLLLGSQHILVGSCICEESWLEVRVQKAASVEMIKSSVTLSSISFCIC